MTEEITVTACCGQEKTIKIADIKTEGLDSHFQDIENGEQIKEVVKQRYAYAATHATGCGCGCSPDSSDSEFSFVGDEYEGHEGYVAEADLGLGCGVPTDLAGISEGDTVLDLGSGAGIDAFIARREVGSEGNVIGVDLTPEMISRARENTEKLGYDNVRFLEGDIENLPVDSNTIDVVISNCVLNLVPHKYNAFSEMHRVLKNGGHFTVSDIVIQGELPERLRESAELYAGCVSGAIERSDYLNLLSEVGFSDIQVLKEHEINIADEILLENASAEEVAEFRKSGGISSITVTGYRKN